MTRFLAQLIAELLRLLLPVLTAPSTIETGAREPECLRDRLTDSIRKAGWIVCLCAVLCTASGCVSTRGIIIPAGDPVRLREHARVRVWMRGVDGVVVPGRMTAPAGWYLLPDPLEVQQ